MKISKLFHWLYASVMFLPLLIIPMFALWTINHDNNAPIEVEITENRAVVFNQLFDYNDFPSSSNEGNVSFVNNNDGTITANGSGLGVFEIMDIKPLLTIGHQYLLRTDFTVNGSIAVGSNSTFEIMCLRFGATSNFNCYYQDNINTFQYRGNESVMLRLVVRSGYTAIDLKCAPQLFDLTLMFGAGNEPSYQEFDNYFPLDYYDFDLGSQYLIQNVNVQTLDNTDIGSQFLYTLYRSTDEYLNFDDVLNLGAISDWIELNVFNGNAPLVYTIVWHYLDYWLILSIFWLCFDVLIYVPQIAHRWLDKASLE